MVFYDKHNCPQHDLIPGPRALQSGMLPLDHCDLTVNIGDRIRKRSSRRVGDGDFNETSEVVLQIRFFSDSVVEDSQRRTTAGLECSVLTLYLSPSQATRGKLTERKKERKNE